MEKIIRDTMGKKSSTETGPRDIWACLYAAGEDGDGDAAAGHLEMLIRLAAGFQFKEAGILDHLRRVAAYVEILARRAGMAEVDVQRLKLASVFHDVGMSDVPEAILKKEGALSNEELGTLKKHTQFGHALLSGSSVPLLDLAADIALSHHESFDGTGYPRRVAGEAIPLEARITAAADVFDALTSKRPFKEPYPMEVALELLIAKSGTQFDPAVVETLVDEREAFEMISTALARPSPALGRGFRVSARDLSRGELFAIAREGYFSCPFCKQAHARDADRCPETDSPLADIHKLSGIVLDDKYRLRGALGVGGMGVVYEAEHLLIGRKLAVKFLTPEASRESANIMRFYNEARVFSTVGHPNLVEVTDMGWTHEKIPYIVMELLDGRDLCEHIFYLGRMKPIAAATVMLEVLRTLEVVHEKGIVHRDLKPENIFFVKDGEEDRVKILDFGVSCLISLERNTRLTQDGFVFGTPQYMSPEQAAGSDRIDHRSDLFTLGAIFYEMLTGEEAFKGDNPLSVIASITGGGYIPVGEIVHDIPPEIEAVVKKALEANRELRYQDAAEFALPLVDFAEKDERYKPSRILDLWKSAGLRRSYGADGAAGVDDGDIHDKPTKQTKIRWGPKR
jgi:serine/threonine protein kinase